MKKLILSFFILSAILFLTSLNSTLQAVTAYPYPIVFTQPDGSQLTITMKGDEKIKWAETTDGYSLLFDSIGYYEYAVLKNNKDMVPSGIIAKEISQRSTSDNTFLSSVPKKLFYSTSQISLAKQVWTVYESEKSITVFPTIGSKKLVCILIGFTDLAFTKTQADFTNLFNQLSYTADGATGSVKDFYRENSYNQFDLTVTVAGPFTASQNKAYYGGNDASGNDLRPRELVSEAVTAANASVDYSNFDNDGDGYVDAVYVIYAGYGEEAGGGANAIWAHAWNLSTTLFYDGKYISKYSCSPELRSNTGSGLTRIGVICHEFGHVLGAPDFYDTNYTTNGQYPGTDDWDLMSGGSWNNSGATPAHHNAYTKCKIYNWGTITKLSSGQTVNVYNSVQNTNSFYRYNTTTTNEYFLCENRQPVGFDAGLPGHGLIIYHVDSAYIATHTSTGDINVGAHQGMYPMSAISTTASGVMQNGNLGVSGCPWPGTSMKTQFTDYTTPSSRSWAGANTPWTLTNITEDVPNKTITFSISDKCPSNFAATTYSSSQVNLSWILNSGNPVMLVYNTTPDFGTPVNGKAYIAGNTITGGGRVLYCGTNTSYNHTNLSPGIKYYYRLFSIIPTNTYSNNVARSAYIFTLPFNESFTYTQIPDYWTQYDSPGLGRIWQFGTISAGTNTPALTGNYAFLNSDAYGSGNTENTDLITPSFDLTYFTGINISFKHFFLIYTGSSGTVSYSINNGSTWTSVATYTTSTNGAVASLSIPSAVNGKTQVKFKWNYTGTYGYFWAIDDIQITGTNINDRQWNGSVSSDWNNSANWTGGAPVALSNITVPSGTPKTLVINATPASPVICNNLTVNNGGYVTINAGKALTVNGVLTNNGTFTIKSDASSIGSLINKWGITGAGSFVVERWVSSNTSYRWEYISSPIATASSAIFTSSTPSRGLYYTNEPTNSWLSYTASLPGTMTVMKGYTRKFVAGETATDGIRSFTGTLNTGDQSIALSGTIINSVFNGWNLVGNPYPSTINWDAVGWTKTNIDAAIYFRSNGNYVSYAAGLGDATPYIPPMQAFWVRVTPGQTSGTLISTNDVRVHNAHNTYKDLTLINTLHITATNNTNGLTDGTYIRFNQDATDAFDSRYDAYKMYAADSAYPQVYTRSGNDDISINNISDLVGDRTIPLGFKTILSGQFTFTADLVSSFTNNGNSVFFEDLQTGTYQDLSANSSYIFNSGATDGLDRFLLHFKHSDAGIAQSTGNSIQIYANNNMLYVSSAGENATVLIYNMLGQQVLSESINAGTFYKINTNLTSDFYLVEVISAKNAAVKKVFIN